MSFRKITFNNANVRAADHGAIFAGILADGIIKGCDLSVSGGTVSMTSGYFVVAGRLIENNATKTFSMSGHGPVCRIYLLIDISNDDTSLESMVVYEDVNDAASLDTLVRGDINGGNGTQYAFEIAVVDVTNNAFIRTMSVCARPISVLDAVPTGNDWSGYSDGIYLVKESS